MGDQKEVETSRLHGRINLVPRNLLHAHDMVWRAFEDLGIDSAGCEELGIDVPKIAYKWALETKNGKTVTLGDLMPELKEQIDRSRREKTEEIARFQRVRIKREALSVSLRKTWKRRARRGPSEDLRWR